MFWLIFSLLALTAAGLVVYAAKSRKISHAVRAAKPAVTATPSMPRNVTRRVAVPRGEPFEAVSIVPGLASCPAARELRNHRFLIGQEPSLPLSDCTSKNCTCRLRQHPDRRNDGDRADRRNGVGLPSEIHHVESRPEKRQRRPRRRSDTTKQQ